MVVLLIVVVVIMVEVVTCTRILVHGCSTLVHGRYILETLLGAQNTLILILNNTQNTTLPKSALF